MNELPPIFGTIPGWITAGGITGLLGVVLWFILGKGKLAIAAKEVAIEATKVENADEADIRDHYAREVEELRKALIAASERHGRRERLFLMHERQLDRRHRDALAESGKRHEDCVREREELRDSVRDLKDIVGGLIGIIRQASASQAIQLGDEASDFVRGAAERVAAMFRPKIEEKRS